MYVDNAIYSCRLISFLLNSFASRVLGRVASNYEESTKQRILLKILESGPEGMGRSELTRRTQWVTKVGRNHMLADLIQGGFIVAIDVNERDGIIHSKNKVSVKKLQYWAVEHYNHGTHGVRNAKPVE